MKKVLAFMLAAMMMASMAVGCGNDGSTSSADAGTATDTRLLRRPLMARSLQKSRRQTLLT